MNSILVRQILLWLLLVTAFSQISAQTTTTAAAAATTTTASTPVATAETTTASSTTTPTLTTEAAGGTTLTAADSAAPTTTVATESSNLEATTEGTASNEALSTSNLKRGYRFESTRKKPIANQEANPQESGAKDKSEEKKIAWKFGRGGNNQEGWSVRPNPNSGYPLWKKEAPASNGAAPQVEQGVSDAEGKKNNDQQAYIVWNVGQGNVPNGWTLSATPDGWGPGQAGGAAPVVGGWPPPDAVVEPSPGNNGWNAGGWVEEQPTDEEDTQGGWVEEGVAPQINAEEGWSAQGGAPQQEGWAAPPAGNLGNGWANGPPQGPAVNSPQPNAWAAQPNGHQKNGWNARPSQGGNDGAEWIAPQQGGNGWAPQQPVRGVQPDAPAAVNGWNAGPVQVDNSGWNQNGNGWAPPAANGGWNNNAPSSGGGGWNGDQANVAGWNAGLQDDALSWKVYNEDTRTMENLDDNSGWKVIGDGGDEGWKLIDDKGNIEWKIENINGEWKVTSADELPTVDNSTATEVEAANATTDATNATSEEATATTPAPSGGWDDDKQGRYIVWKFSEDGKGEARVYGGRGTEPEVWSVGDNNQYWKETMGIKSNGNNAQNANNGWSADGTAWQNDGGWQNSYQPGSGSWQTTGTTTPQQNNGWNNGAPGVSPQGKGPGWQSGGPTAPASNGWKNGANVAPKPENNRGWQTGNAAHQGGGNGWQQKAPAAPQTTTWSNVGSTPQHVGGWQNQQPQAAGAWNNGGAAPQTAGGWQNTAPVNQPVNGGWKDTGTVTQAGWQNGNGAVAPQSGGGWAPGTNGRKGRTKGRWRNPGARARNTNGWQPNKQANGKKNVARNPWNSRNRASSWAQGNGGATVTTWNNSPAPSVAPTVNTNGKAPNSDSWKNGGNKAGVSGGWSANGKNPQTVPYIIVIKTPDGATAGAGQGATNSWSNGGGPATTNRVKVANGNKPRNNRRSSGWKMNRAGSSGWQWNPQGGSEGWKWMDGWMGSGGGFGGWMSDKDTMYSGWKPTQNNGASSTASKSPNQRIGTAPKTKKSGGKMVFVFGTKKNSSGGWAKPNGKKKGKQVIILDYTTAGKKAPKGEDGMKKDIESVIQALKTGKPTGVQGGRAWKQAPQENQQQWG